MAFSEKNKQAAHLWQNGLRCVRSWLTMQQNTGLNISQAIFLH